MHDKQVLVVDDGEDDRYILSELLSDAGIRVKTVSNGTDALAALRDNGYDAAIIDLSMPDMDGWQLLERIRELPGGTDLPVIAVTAYYSSNVRQAVHNAGFNSYQTKPVSDRTFVDAVLSLIDTRG